MIISAFVLIYAVCHIYHYIAFLVVATCRDHSNLGDSFSVPAWAIFSPSFFYFSNPDCTIELSTKRKITIKISESNTFHQVQPVS